MLPVDPKTAIRRVPTTFRSERVMIDEDNLEIVLNGNLLNRGEQTTFASEAF